MIEALYLHIPFCTSRCAYCDFATQACHDETAMDTYVDALSIKIRRASKAGLLGGLKTIYIGGGTPTHLGARRLNSLVYLLSLSINLESVEEFTVECNPESLTEAMVKDLYALGVSRFSIGVQGFDESTNRIFARAHTPVQAVEAVKTVQTRCDNVSVDLMCGAPNQTMKSWRASLQKALDLGVKHVSVYPLTVEEGTALEAMVEAGEWDGPNEELQADMMLAAQEILEGAGMHRYEVASYAFPGFESRHNTAYWTGVSYLGLGLGAASMMDAGDFQRCKDARLWDDECPEPKKGHRIRVQRSLDGAVELEELSLRESVLEDAMLGLRRSKGLSDEFVSHACEIVPELTDTLSELAEKGLIQKGEGMAVRPTQRGWLMGNELYGAVWALA